MNWVRTRVTGMLNRSNGTHIKFLLGERDDGGVFFQEFRVYGNALDEAMLENARLELDKCLMAPLNPKSVGNFDVEPNFYIPGMSPARL